MFATCQLHTHEPHASVVEPECYSELRGGLSRPAQPLETAEEKPSSCLLLLEAAWAVGSATSQPSQLAEEASNLSTLTSSPPAPLPPP